MADDQYFEAGYHTDRFYELEEDLIKFLRFMPLEIYNNSERRKGVKSPYLADLLIRIGSNIDVYFRKLILLYYHEIDEERRRGNKPYLSFKHFQKLNEKFMKREKKLSECNIRIIQTGEDLMPFKDWSNQTPSWWNSYNHVKHEALIDEANLDNVLESLAAFFLLICFRKNSAKLVQYGYVCIPPNFKKKILSNLKSEINHDIITNIFISPVDS
jgi:hypothetical protein